MLVKRSLRRLMLRAGKVGITRVGETVRAKKGHFCLSPIGVKMLVKRILERLMMSAGKVEIR